MKARNMGLRDARLGESEEEPLLQLTGCAHNTHTVSHILTHSAPPVTPVRHL